MRIALAHAFYRVPGGEDRYVRQQAQLLSQHHDVLLMRRENEHITGSLRDAGAMLFSPGLNRKVVEELREWDPDVVHMHNPYPSFGPAIHLASRRLGKPLVMTVHNMRLRCPNAYMFTEGEVCRRCLDGVYLHAVVNECFPSKKQAAAYATTLWLHRFVLRVEKFVSLFIAPSEFMGARLVEWGLPAERVRVVRNFAAVPEGANPAPGRFVTFLGRLSSEKGVDVLLNALALAGDLPCRIVGGGPLEAELRGLADRLNLTRTEFLGLIAPAGVTQILREARVVVVPSLSEETASLSALEALGSARPVVVSDLGALSELAAGGRGSVFPAGDAEALARLIVLYAGDDERCEDAGREAARFAAVELNAATHLKGLLETYSEAAARAA